MQPEKLAEVRSWLKKAASDLRGADIDLAASPPFIEDMLFHCQQAAEKSMKGFLTAHDRVFRKTHDLDELGYSCEAVDPTLKEVLNAARDLTVRRYHPLGSRRSRGLLYTDKGNLQMDGDAGESPPAGGLPKSPGRRHHL